MIRFVFTVLVWLTSERDAEALVRTAPTLTVDQATEHLAAARFAGAVYGVDSDLLLAIAWRESRYQATAISRESGGRVSCGAMTPTPVARCPARQTVLDGYLAGAEHLRVWLRATRSQRAALLGYAGGYRMISACKSGPLERVRAGRVVDLCTTPEVRRAAWIRREREKGSTRG